MKVKPGCRSNAVTAQYNDCRQDDFDDSDIEEPRERGQDNKERNPRKAPMSSNKNASRTRPTNNQLLYKAYFRWQHFGKCPSALLAQLPYETDACASVTAAFLQVLSTLQKAENLTSESNRRNILQILSNNTRRTKVVELSTGTHRVPEELRKHYLTDGQGGQYSTNLDRNRYGNDDQYLFTVIRYDLEYLGFCGCLVDVEIIDAKANSQAILVSNGPEACTCCKDLQEEPQARERSPQRAPAGGDSPKLSASARSDLFDALVTVATGGTDPDDNDPKPSSKTAKAPANPKRWSTALSWDGEQDSLQVALDAFKKMEFGATSAQSLSLLNFSISKMGLPGPNSGMGPVEDDVASDLCQPLTSQQSGELHGRKRSRKPVKRSGSWLGPDAAPTPAPQLPPIGVHEASDENAKEEAEPAAKAAGGSQSGDCDSDGLKAAENAEAGENDPVHEADDSPLKPSAGGAGQQRRRLHYVARQSSAINLGTRLSPAELKRLAAEVQCLRDENSKLTDQLREETNLSGAAQLRKDLDSERGKVRDLESQMAQLRQDLQLLVNAKQTEEEKNKTLMVELTSTKSLLDGLAKAFAGGGGLLGMGVNNLLGANAAAAAAAAALSQLNNSTLSSHGLMDPLNVPASLPISLGSILGNNLFGASLQNPSLLGATSPTAANNTFQQASSSPNNLSLSMLNDPASLLKSALGSGLPNTLASLGMLPNSNLPMFQQLQPGSDGLVSAGGVSSPLVQNMHLPMAAMANLAAHSQGFSGLQGLMGLTGLQSCSLGMQPPQQQAQQLQLSGQTGRVNLSSKRTSEDAGLTTDHQHADKRIAWDMAAASPSESVSLQAAAALMSGNGPQLVKVEQ